MASIRKHPVYRYHVSDSAIYFVKVFPEGMTLEIAVNNCLDVLFQMQGKQFAVACPVSRVEMGALAQPFMNPDNIAKNWPVLKKDSFDLVHRAARALFQELTVSGKPDNPFLSISNELRKIFEP
ncbi:MAG: hypothetical protein KDD02_14515 [Phaeodactylibacter sp.]|nr:hypothetical protein [Phaeodactylibacter sp.]MCB9302665.1 hypothetical protein [Lewinellaceae bacterium]